ncbi:hypothetical protein KRX19_07645 [Cardiobacteriaceae bacterium TAE3-ERU3]|nr:hypothetical protein [Cardiobacteriaceae bacterium TAE3-ERU3]
MTVTIIIATIVLTAVWLLIASRRPLTPPDQKREARDLVALYDAQPEAADPTQQSERDYRLYHELKRLQQHRTSQHSGRLPIWIVLLTITALGAAGYAWYMLGGSNTLQWQKLDSTLDAPLIRSQYLGEQTPQLPAEDLNAYCQLLQTRIDRNDPDQLDTLARCYLQYNNFPYAAAVYHSLYRLQPDDDKTALNYAQATLFGSRNRPMSEEIETILQRIIHNDPQDIMPQILLAAGYRQSDRNSEALPMWQALADNTAKDHPLYPMIEQTLADTKQAIAQDQNDSLPVSQAPEAASTSSNSSANAASTANTDSANTDAAKIRTEISISPELLAQITPQAKLYLIASPVGSRMPLAVSRHDPQAQQTITLSDEDSMSGATLGDQPSITLRAKLSPDGNAMSQPLAESEQTVTLPAADTIHIEL